MIRVLIADDHTIVREGLKQIFMETDDILASGEAGNGQEVIKKIEKDSYDVVLLDILLPGKSGLDVLKDIRSISPAQRVLMLSMYPEEQYAIRSLRAGASGYLTKASAPIEHARVQSPHRMHKLGSMIGAPSLRLTAPSRQAWTHCRQPLHRSDGIVTAAVPMMPKSWICGCEQALGQPATAA